MPSPSIEKAQGSETVEPSVGNALNEARSILFRFPLDTHPLFCFFSQVRRVTGEDEIELPTNCFNELAADGRGKIL